MKCSLFLISLFLHLCTFGYCDLKAEGPKRCNIAYKCSTENKPVWTTTDDINCEVFRNNCFLLNENCQRINRDDPEAVDIGKERCQELCKSSSVCPDIHSPVCGYYNEEKQTFSSQCEMKNYVCKTGKPFDLFSNGACLEEN